MRLYLYYRGFVVRSYLSEEGVQRIAPKVKEAIYFYAHESQVDERVPSRE